MIQAITQEMMAGWRRDFLSKEGDPEYSHQVKIFL
jgi:hypothetical protein